MYTVNFRVATPFGSQFIYSLPVSRLKIKRQSKRVRYDFITGGTDSYWIGARVLFEFAWEYLSPSEYATLQSIIGYIRHGNDNWKVYVTGISPAPTYQATFLYPWVDIQVDLETDEITEMDVEFEEQMAMEIVFVSKEALKLWI